MSAWLRSAPTQKKHDVIIKPEMKEAVFRQGSDYSFVPHEVFYENYRPLVENCLTKSEILIATAIDEPDQIFGCTVYRYVGEVTVVSFCYVKHTFRRMGLARAMIEKIKMGPIAATHCAPWLSQSFKRNKIIFNPFLDFKFAK
jgi:hypothetical protein